MSLEHCMLRVNETALKLGPLRTSRVVTSATEEFNVNENLERMQFA